MKQPAARGEVTGAGGKKNHLFVFLFVLKFPVMPLFSKNPYSGVAKTEWGSARHHFCPNIPPNCSAQMPLKLTQMPL